MTKSNAAKAAKTQRQQPKDAAALAREWAKGRTRDPGGQPCATCRYGSTVRAIIQAVIEEKAAGTSEATVTDLHKFLVEHAKYRPSTSALRQHLRLHTSWA